MNTMSRSLCLGLVTAGLSAGPSAWGQSAEDEVRDVVHRWEQAYNSKDVATIIEVHEPDAVIMPPGYPASIGHAAMEADMNAFFAETTPNHSVANQEILVDGDMAVERADYVDVLTPVAGGEAVTDRGKHVQVFRRGADGKWRILWAIWNSTPE